MARGAIKQTPVSIPMATGQDSQLEMLTRPEFGGGMADVETAAALRANLPTRTSIDLEKLMAAAAFESPLEAAKMLSKEDKAPSSVKEYEFAVQNGFKGSYTDFIARKTPATNINVDTGKGIASQIGPMLKDARRK